ncbi:hypothetical protein VTJ83DRAFT_4578 [Remersonia thermophila]|uniref:Uncharacterized protein n=1 Tax=Remersonia thermophila TaxID=72144 RepID=A0ABR4DAD3_9PEZI
MSAPQQESRLLSLPAELRNLIYEHIFAPLDAPMVSFKLERRPAGGGGGGGDDDDRPRLRPTFERPPHWLALFYTCRQTYTETVPFVMFGPVQFGSFLLSPEEQLDKAQCFFQTVGRRNAAFLTMASVGFPELRLIRGGGDAENSPRGNAEGEIRGVELARADLDLLRALQEYCPKLRYLGFVVYPKAQVHLLKAWVTMNEDVWDDVKRAMTQLDAELQKFPLLLRSDVVMVRHSDLKNNTNSIGYGLYKLMDSFSWRLLGTSGADLS